MSRVSSRPHLLFLCQTLPFPPDGGVHIRSYNVLRLLARDFQVSAICFFRERTRPTAATVRVGVEGLSAYGSVSAFPIPQEQSVIRLLWDHGRSVMCQRAYTFFTYQSGAFRAELRKLLGKVRFDLVHLDSLDLAAYLPLLADIPVVCTHHNVESILLGRRANNETSMWTRAYIRLQSRLVEREEKRWCSAVALNVTCSDVDAEELKRLVPAARVTVVPNGVDVDAFRPEHGRDEGVVFVGGGSWFPNRDAMAFLGQEVLPLLRAGGMEIPVTWVGRTSAEERRKYGRYGITTTGFVDDVRPYVRDAACFVAPLRVGGGTRLKILDAWAMGKAVVSTSVGCEGLKAVDGENILIRDTAGGFADAVRTVLGDPAMRRELGAAARRTAEQVYSWELIGHELAQTYLGLTGRSF